MRLDLKRALYILLLASCILSQDVSLSLDCPEEVVTGSDNNHIQIVMDNDFIVTGGEFSFGFQPDSAASILNSNWVADDLMIFYGFNDGGDSYSAFFWGGGMGYLYPVNEGPVIDITFSVADISGDIEVSLFDIMIHDISYVEHYPEDASCSISVVQIPFVYLYSSNYNPDEGTLEVWLETSIVLNGIEFQVTGFLLSDVTPGNVPDDQDMDFSWDEQGSISFTVANEVLPVGEYLLCSVIIDQFISLESCFVNVAVYGENGLVEPLSVEDCFDTNICSFPGDLNLDYQLNILDIILIINCIVQDGSCPCADLNFDLEVNILDILEIVNIILGI